MNIILIGFQGCGKTFIGSILAKELGKVFVDIDVLICEQHYCLSGKKLSCREICRVYGEDYFRRLETKVLYRLEGIQDSVIATGGGIVEGHSNISLLKRMGCLIYLFVDKDLLWDRFVANGVPAYYDNFDPQSAFEQLYRRRMPIYAGIADYTLTL